MKKLLFLLAIICVLKANAQNYLITFSGSGAASTVSTVKVENLTKGTSLTLNGGDILRLTGTVGISSIENKQSSEIKIYPNPMVDNSTVEIYPPVAGDAIISVYDMTGKPVTQIQSYLGNYRQEFRLSGLKNGFYLINVKGNTYQFSGKLLCNGKSNGTISIEKISNNTQAVGEKKSTLQSKGAMSTIDMLYSSGDRLKFTAISGVYSTVITDIPTQDKTVTFNFIACTDGDNNNYPVVAIGTQVWMAENLKTTKYRNGELIGTTAPATLDITNEITPKYQWAYGGDENNVTVYGRLYTWYAATDSRNLCSTGWYIPTDADLTILTTFLGGETVAGSKLKETGTTHWSLPNTGATNETGFTALPAGERNYNGTFSKIGSAGYWCSSSAYNSVNTWYRALFYNQSYVYRNGAANIWGYSIRCLKTTAPKVTTTNVTTYNRTSATVGGNVTADGGATVTERGVYWGTSQNPETTGTKLQIGNGTGSFSTSLSGLIPNTPYYIKAYATNSVGTSYGNGISFMTSPVTAPVLTTTIASSITQTAATSGGNVTSDGGANVTARGVCWSTSANPTIADNHTSDGTGTGIFISNLPGLTINTKYYLKAYATNSIGTAYGNEIIFATKGAIGTVSDVDGNTYSTIMIGTQVWMTENLKTTKYNDGTSIPKVTGDAAWLNLTTPGYCWYNNDSITYKTPYGALYNWYAVNTGNLCPAGWHVPTEAEYRTLDTYLGSNSGGKLKEIGTTHWASPNTGATNETGFTSLPSGERYDAFYAIGYYGFWWSTLDYSATHAGVMIQYNNSGIMDGDWYKKQCGFSVRCLK
jgi:uncharacterized protein (TIGR02145 family)